MQKMLREANDVDRRADFEQIKRMRFTNFCTTRFDRSEIVQVLLLMLLGGRFIACLAQNSQASISCALPLGVA